MKFINFILWLGFFFLSCQSSPVNRKSNQIISAESEAQSNKKLITDTVSANISDTAHFLNNCLELMSHSTIGQLMGINRGKDSTEYLCFAACYKCKETYEIIFIYKGTVQERRTLGYDQILKEYNNGCKNNFENFNCFAFVNPMRDPDKQKDESAMNIDFPVNVKIYERVTGDIWKFLKNIKVKTFEEYQILRFKTIYKIDE